MTEEQKPRFEAVLRKLAVAFGKPLTKGDHAAVWLEVLSDRPIEHIETACLKVLKSTVTKLTPGQFRELVNEEYRAAMADADAKKRAAEAAARPKIEAPNKSPSCEPRPKYPAWIPRDVSEQRAAEAATKPSLVGDDVGLRDLRHDRRHISQSSHERIAAEKASIATMEAIGDEELRRNEERKAATERARLESEYGAKKAAYEATLANPHATHVEILRDASAFRRVRNALGRTE